MSTRKRPPAAPKDKLHEFHIMRFGATPARLVAVVRATDEKSALAEAIERHRIPPHLQRRLIVVRAASLDGFGLAKWVREHRPGVEVILAGTLPRTVRQAEELCEEGLLPKPYDPCTIKFDGCSLLERP